MFELQFLMAVCFLWLNNLDHQVRKSGTVFLGKFRAVWNHFLFEGFCPVALNRLSTGRDSNLLSQVFSGQVTVQLKTNWVRLVCM